MKMINLKHIGAVFVNTSLMLLSNLAPGKLSCQVRPIALHPVNPHYFIYKNKPEILITSGEHYGALTNLDFNYAKYFGELQLNGLNLTRVFTGEYVEPANAFNIDKNTMAPAAGRFQCPWLRSPVHGYANGGNKFDLAQWDPAYFDRLKDLMSAARERGIIIELALFCPFYEDQQWVLSPLNPMNNINGYDTLPRTDVYTLDKSGKLLAVQEAMVRKIVDELKGFDNLIYEICNEPYFGGVTMEWQHHIAEVIHEAEEGFQNRHLVSQNIANYSAKITDPNPAVSVFNFHYAAPPYAVAANYNLNKVIGDNETGFAGQADSTYRREAWQFLLAGGGLYNNLDYSFTTGREDGTFVYPANQPGGGSAQLRKQLGYLKSFLYRFDFINMRPDSTLVTKVSSGKMPVYALTEPAKQYAIYFYQSPGASVELKLPPANYEVEWMNPVTGAIDAKTPLKHAGGKLVLVAPVHGEDIALRIIKARTRQSKE